MNLQLFVKGKLIASMPINASYVNYPPYLPALKSELQKRHWQIIEEEKAEPAFQITTGSLNSGWRAFANSRPLL
jgi:hypothetical protein